MAFIFTYECPPTNGVRIDCITYSQLIFMPKKEKRVQSSSLQQSFSIRNDKLFYLSLSVRLQRTGLLEVTFDCRDCKPSLREFSQSYFFPHSGTGRIPCSQRVTGAERFLWPSHNPVFFKSVALKSTKSSRNDSNYENTFQKPGMSLLNKRASLYARTLEFVLPFIIFLCILSQVQEVCLELLMNWLRVSESFWIVNLVVFYQCLVKFYPGVHVKRGD